MDKTKRIETPDFKREEEVAIKFIRPADQLNDVQEHANVHESSGQKSLNEITVSNIPGKNRFGLQNCETISMESSDQFDENLRNLTD